MKITRHLRIEGRVQGVGYRYAFCSEAEAGGVCGWVRNRRDGSVEAIVQGSPEAVQKLISWAHRGPPAAQVLAVREQAAPADFERPYGGFDALPSA